MEMTEEDLLSLLRDPRFLEKARDALEESLREQHGGLSFILQELKEEPAAFVATAMKAINLSQGRVLEPKVAELIAISAASALHCQHCLLVHLHRARTLGASSQEILHTLLLSAAIAESATLAVSLREWKKVARIEMEEGQS